MAESLAHSDCKLKTLNLSHNYQITDGVKHLAEALLHSDCTLNSLNLSYTDHRVTDKGVKHLAEVHT